MHNEIYTPLKKSRNINIESLPKISKTYSLYKKYGNLRNKHLSKNGKIKIIKEEVCVSNFFQIQQNLLKYNISKNKLGKFIINKLIKPINCHLLAQYKDNLIYGFKKELLKRYYKKKESKERIPIYIKYYRNYLQFFCKPIFSDYYINKLIHEYEETKARIYYSNCCDKNKNKPKTTIENESLKTIFNKSVRNEIDKLQCNDNDYILNNSKDETIPENTILHSYKESSQNSIKSILSLFNFDNKKKIIKRKDNKFKSCKKIIKDEKINNKYKTRNYQIRQSLYLDNEISEHKILNTDGNEKIENNKKKLKLCDIKAISIQTNLDLNIIKKENERFSFLKSKISKNQKENNIQNENINKLNNNKIKKNYIKKARIKSRRIIKEEKENKYFNKTQFAENNIKIENKKELKIFSTSSRIVKNSKHSSISTNFYISPFQRKAIKNNNSARVFSAEQTTTNSDFSYSTLKNKNNLKFNKDKTYLKKYNKKSPDK